MKRPAFTPVADHAVLVTFGTEIAEDTHRAVVALDRYHQGSLKPALLQWRKQGSLGPPPYSKSVGRVNETGMLFVAMAGMMNIILVIDCATRARVERGAA